MTQTEPGWSLDRICAHIAENLPLVGLFGMTLAAATPEGCDLVIDDHPGIFRPGDMVAGPVLFTAADAGAYGLILAAGGPPEATTIDLTIHFLRPGKGLPLLARTTPIKLGRRIATTDTIITPMSDPTHQIARATSTYMIG